MSKKIGYTLLFIFGMLVSWFMGYVKVPYLDVNYIFWYGFFGCLFIILFLISIFYLSKNKKLIQHFDSIFPTHENSKSRPYFTFEILLLLLSIGLFAFCLINYSNNNKLLQKLSTTQNELSELKQQANLQDQKNKISILMDILHKLDSIKIKSLDKNEIKGIIDQVVALSYSFKPSKIWDQETNSYESLSAERGMLLVALLYSNIDTSYFNVIKSNVSFAYADLRNVDLQGKNLSGIDLNYAHLEYANFQGAILNNAKLKYANMVGINLNKASLVEANLIGAQLSWAKMNDANMESIHLDSVDASNSILNRSNLKDATIIKSQIRNAVFSEANFNNTYLLETDLSNSDLSNSNLIRADIGKTNLNGLNFNNSRIQENWLELLELKNAGAMKVILEKYELQLDTISIPNTVTYKLISKSTDAK